MVRDSGLDNLLELDGSILDQGDGYWVKIEARLVMVTEARPHGIKYSLSLHEPFGERIMGFDNAHGVKAVGKGKYAGRRVIYDHKHTGVQDKGSPYEFSTAYQLVEDFWKDVDKILKQYMH